MHALLAASPSGNSQELDVGGTHVLPILCFLDVLAMMSFFGEACVLEHDLETPRLVFDNREAHVEESLLPLRHSCSNSEEQPVVQQEALSESVPFAVLRKRLFHQSVGVVEINRDEAAEITRRGCRRWVETQFPCQSQLTMYTPWWSTEVEAEWSCMARDLGGAYVS